MRSEETTESISAAGVSEVSRTSTFTEEGVSELMLLLMKGVLLHSELGFEEVVEIPFGESGGQSPIERDGKLFFAEGGREHFEKYLLN